MINQISRIETCKFNVKQCKHTLPGNVKQIVTFVTVALITVSHTFKQRPLLTGVSHSIKDANGKQSAVKQCPQWPWNAENPFRRNPLSPKFVGF